MRIAFIGLGQRGRPMAVRLLRAGYEPAVHKRSRGGVDALVTLGARASGTPAEAAREADVVMTCLLHPEQAREVCFGPHRALERAVPNFIRPGDVAPAFTMEGIVKDLDCGIRATKSLGLRLMLAPVAQQRYGEASALGHAQEGLAAVVRPMERIAGVEVRDRGAIRADLSATPDRLPPIARPAIGPGIGPTIRLGSASPSHRPASRARASVRGRDPAS